MTEIPDRVRGRTSQPYEARSPRYASNAEREAMFSEQQAARWQRSAYYDENASDNAREHGDLEAARLYAEMADAADDAADALLDRAEYARKITEHYGSSS